MRCTEGRHQCVKSIACGDIVCSCTAQMRMQWRLCLVCLFVHIWKTNSMKTTSAFSSNPRAMKPQQTAAHVTASIMKWMKSNRTYLYGSRQHKVRQPFSCPQPSFPQASSSSLAALPQAQETMYDDEGQASAPSLQGWEAPPALSPRR